MIEKIFDKVDKVKFRTRFDKLWAGVLAGFLAPMLAFLIYYLVNYTYMSIPAFIRYVINGNAYTQIMSLCAIANLPLFYIFLELNAIKGTRGIILMTLIFAILNFVLKFIA